MENATKALLIAAAVLMGIMVITLGVTLYVSIMNQVVATREEMEANAIYKFNTQFLNYETPDTVTFQDVISAASLAYQSNSQYTFDTASLHNGNDFYVSVLADVKITQDGSYSQKNIENIVGNAKDLADLLSYNFDVKYKCTSIKISDSTKRVYQIIFTKN